MIEKRFSHKFPDFKKVRKSRKLMIDTFFKNPEIYD